LVEILIVLGLLVVVGTIVISVLNPNGQFKKARDATRKSDLAQYRTQLEIYANKNNSIYPNAARWTVDTLCTTVGMSGTTCKYDPLQNNKFDQPACQGGAICEYILKSSASSYVVYAGLEKATLSNPSNCTTSSACYWVVCSSGISGERNSVPVDSTCPF